MICIYHSNCADGFTGAWVVKEAFKKNTLPIELFHPGIYGEPPPDIRRQDVIMVDFSYKRSVIQQIINDCRSLVILDHHKTAQEELSNFIHSPNVEIVFDMNRSGARIAWDYLMGTPPPELLLHIEDQDLWRFALEGTRQIAAAVYSYPYTFEAWDNLFYDRDCDELFTEGASIERAEHKNVLEQLKNNIRTMVIGGVEVPVANIPYFMASQAGNIMASSSTFAACYSDQSQHRVFSLRSTDRGLDVSEIAKKYGGGGHRNAAGFRMPIGWEGDKVL